MVIDIVLLLTGILPLVLLFVKKEALNIKQPIVLFVWLTAVATLYEWIGTAVFKINAAYWFQCYSLLSFGALYHFFVKLLESSYKKILNFFLISFIVIYGISFLFFDKTNSFTSTSINEPFITIFVLVFSFLWFKKLFQKVNIPNLWKHADFYFVSGLMVYYSGTFFFFLLSNSLFSSNSYFYDYWMVNIIATVLLRIFIIAGLWNMKRN